MLYILILTNIKLKHAIMMSYFLTISDGVFQDNSMTFISHIPPLEGGNYRVWQEKYELALALSENDLALTSPCLT